MRIKGRKEGGEGDDDSYLSFLEKFWEKRATRKGFLLEIVLLRGCNSRACTRFGLGGPKGYLWSWVVGETSPVGMVARLVWAG